MKTPDALNAAQTPFVPKYDDGARAGDVAKLRDNLAELCTKVSAKRAADLSW